jgi:hypothetical protein
MVKTDGPCQMGVNAALAHEDGDATLAGAWEWVTHIRP